MGKRRSYFTLKELPGVRIPWYGRPEEAIWRQLRQVIYQRDGGKCLYCAAPVELYACHIHHVLELSENGTNHPSNLKTLCIPCHQARHPFMQSPYDRICE